MPRVFISYRRGDTAGQTGRLLDALERRFGADVFFRDIEGLEPGVDFPEALARALSQCDAMLVMIGPTWTSATGEQGRRLDQEGDFVRLEVTTALARESVLVIPVLVGGATVPAEKELPNDLRALHRRNAIELSDTRWDYDVKRLGGALVKQLGLKEATPPVDEAGGRRKLGKGTMAIAAGIVVLVVGALWLRWLPGKKSPETPAMAASRLAMLKFSLKSDKQDRPILSFQQKHPHFLEPHNIAAEADGHYQENVEWPAPNQEFEGAAVRSVQTSQFDNDPISKTTRMCFASNPKPPTNDPPFAVMMVCSEGNGCSFSPSDFGWATECPKGSSEVRPEFSLVPKMWAESAGQSEVKPGWRVPSLATLKQMTESKRVGYTQFTIQASKLPGLESADSFRYMITANGSPLYVDGWAPQDMLKEFSASKGLDFSFGMENLSFSGGDQGCENIGVVLEFRKGDQPIKTVQLTRRYAALRDAMTEEVRSADGLVFTWAGTYVKPPNEDRTEIFVVSTPDLTEASRTKSAIARANLSYQGRNVVGVLRPPLNEPQYGVVLGLVQPTGQIKFTFDPPTAQALLAWSKTTKVFRRVPFIYQMRPGNSGTGKLNSCSEVSQKR